MPVCKDWGKEAYLSKITEKGNRITNVAKEDRMMRDAGVNPVNMR